MNQYCVHGVVFEIDDRGVFCSGKLVNVGGQQLLVLVELIARSSRNEVLTHQQIAGFCGYEISSNLPVALVSRLRPVIRSCCPLEVRNLYGVGYTLEPAA